MENKSKVFAQYLGQRVVTRLRGYDLTEKRTSKFKEGVLMNVDLAMVVDQLGVLLDEEKVKENLVHFSAGNDCRLILKSLSEISDEEIKELMTVFLGKNPEYFNIERTEDRNFILAHYNNPKTPGEKYSEIRMMLTINCENGHIQNIWDYVYENGTANSRQDHGDIYRLYQYLQSKGYDLPQYLLNGKTLHESGLAVYSHDSK